MLNQTAKIINERHMNLAIIVGSHRSDSQSTKVGNYIKQELEGKGHSVYMLDLRNNPLPFWHEEMWDDSSQMAKDWGPYSEKLHNAEGFVIISPEWSGMATAGIKNFFLMCGDHELSHKPGLIVTVSASRGGAYPVAELRMSSYKNTFINYIPEHIIVRDVEKVLNNHEVNEEDKGDAYIKKRLAHGLGLLEAYTEALNGVRDKDVHDFDNYAFGM